MTLIKTRDLTKLYRGVPALQGLSLSIEAGQVVGLMGDNGAGKTTLLKILASVLQDWQGTATVGGSRPGPETKALVSYLPDRSFLSSSLSPAGAIKQYARFFPDFNVEKAWLMVDYFGLPRDRSLKEMSKGMQEKMQVSLTMARDARVYLLDEPISGVDPAAREIILQGILSQFSPESLMIISTHLLADVEPIVDSVIFLREGRLLLEGSVDELRSEHQLSLDALFRKVYTQ